VSLIYAVVADVVTSSERGSYVVYASIAPQIGPSIGPVIGGLLAEYAHWHFIFWFLVIVACIVFIPLGLSFPETCRKIVGDGSIPPGKLNRCVTNKLREKRAAATDGRSPPSEKKCEASLEKDRGLRFPNPFSVLVLLVQKECGPILIYAALVSSGMYSTVALIPSQFQRIYAFNELQISLCYLPLGCGTIAAAFVRGRIIDSRFRHYAKQLGLEVVRNRKMDLTNFPLERARIEVALPTLFLGAICILGFGWTIQCETNLAGPLVLLFFIGFCASATTNTFQVLLVDIYPGRAGAVTAANNLLRCWLGAGATALVIPMIDAMGIGWTCTFFSLVVIAFSPLLWYIMKHGPEWRREATEKMKRKIDYDPD
jgi:MFS family permease